MVQVSHCHRCQGIKSRYADSFNSEETLNHDRIESQKSLLGIDFWRHLSPAVSRGRTTPKLDLFAQGPSKQTSNLVLRDKDNLNHVLPLTTFQTPLMFGNVRQQNSNFKSPYLNSSSFISSQPHFSLSCFYPWQNLISSFWTLSLETSYSTQFQDLFPSPCSLLNAGSRFFFFNSFFTLCIFGH